MPRLALAFLLGILFAVTASALAAERSDDCNLTIDINRVTGEVRRTLSLTQHHPLVTSQWSAERAAAATSLASWLTWMSTNSPDAYAWISGMTSSQQEGMRSALLKGS